jgi:hypothetical protein
MEHADGPAPVELSAPQRHRQALVLMAVGVVGSLGERVGRGGWRAALQWRTLAAAVALGLALYLFWRWAIAASLRLARALAARRSAQPEKPGGGLRL